MARLEKRIVFCGRNALVACDGNCRKAWGSNNRPRRQLTDHNVDDVVWYADDELGDAPIDPGTYEGGDAKPRSISSGDDLNRWCVRECERSALSGLDGLEDKPLPDFSKRLYNIPSSKLREEAKIIAIAMKVGKHWRDQEGVNAALIDELAEATR